MMASRLENVPTMETCEKVLEQNRAQLMEYKGVLGTGIGLKRENNKIVRSGKRCIVVYVLEKKSQSSLDMDQIIPFSFCVDETFVQTDIIECGTVSLSGDNTEEQKAFLATFPK
jgi:hypothetical protein